MKIVVRKGLAYLILLVFLPAYIIFAVTIISFLDRFSLWLELLVYTLLGIVWVYPFKFIFKGLASKNNKHNKL
tara:strand:- start:136 stop:354 length:219 start_codon:yes stop_codon:yes gene_type:complete